VTSPREDIIGYVNTGGHDIEIVRLVWPDGGLSFDLYVHLDDGDVECLTQDESLGDVPTNDDIHRHLDGWLNEKAST
jgi:hypothetical protein